MKMSGRIDATDRCETGAYTVETSRIDEDAWTSLVERFDDAVLMQTWTYGTIRWREDNLSHVVLKKDGEVVSVAQSVIEKVPLLGTGRIQTVRQRGRDDQRHRACAENSEASV